MSGLDVRRLAALDMWGTAGTLRRRHLIRAEFMLGAAACTGLGALVLATGSGWMIVLGIWLLGAGINYVPLAREAQLLSRPGALDDELSGVELRHELRRAAKQMGDVACGQPAGRCARRPSRKPILRASSPRLLDHVVLPSDDGISIPGLIAPTSTAASAWLSLASRDSVVADDLYGRIGGHSGMYGGD